MTSETSKSQTPREVWQFTLVEKIVGAVLVGLMGWMAVSVQQMAVDVAVMKAQFAAATADRFRASDGALLKAQIAENRKEIERHHERLDQLEIH